MFCSSTGPFIEIHCVSFSVLGARTVAVKKKKRMHFLFYRVKLPVVES